MLRSTSFTRGVTRFTIRKKTFAFVVFVSLGFVFWALNMHSMPSQSIRRLDAEALRRYRPPPQSSVSAVGRRMDVEGEYWSRLIEGFGPLLLTGAGGDTVAGGSSSLLVDRTRAEKEKEAEAEEAGRFVFVTAASRAFYAKSLGAIRSVQTLFPEKKIIFYDLEVEGEGNDFIRKQMSAICGVTYRRFNFSLYPDHIRRLRLYAWKPIIIHEMLREFRGVLWIDSSIRFETNNFTSILSNAASNGGVALLTSTGHSNYAVTHPQMYVFLPTSLQGMIRSVQHEANCVLLLRTPFTVSGVVWWWVLCSLDPLCIAPTDRTACDNPYRSSSIYANCHRFDQSALNLLLANHFAFDDVRYFGGGVVGVGSVAKVNRVSDASEQVAVCPPGAPGPFLADTQKYLVPTRAPEVEGGAKMMMAQTMKKALQ